MSKQDRSDRVRQAGWKAAFASVLALGASINVVQAWLAIDRALCCDNMFTCR